MNIKHISYFLFLFSTHFTHTSPFATRLMFANTEDKKQTHTNQLFIQAEKCAKEFTHAREQCVSIDDCVTNKEYRKTRKSVISSITDLMIHINTYEDDDATDAHEKNEAENMKNQLIQLLESINKR